MRPPSGSEVAVVLVDVVMLATWLWVPVADAKSVVPFARTVTTREEPVIALMC